MTLLKLWLGHGVGKEAPFALFGLAVILTGWIADARSAFASTPVLALLWWYYFFEPRGALTFAGTSTLMQLIVLVAEGLGIGLVLRQMERARNLAQVETQRAKQLQELSSSLAAATTVDEVARVIVAHLGAALNADAALLIRSGSPQELQVLASGGLLSDAPESIVVRADESLGPISDALESARATWVSGSNEDSDGARGPDALRLRELEARATLPLVGARAEVLAVLDLQFKSPKTFAADERRRVESFLSYCAQALVRAQLHAAEVAMRRRLVDLNALSTALSQALSRDDVARIVVERGMAVAHADTCTLYVLDEPSGALELIANRGVPPEILTRIERITPESGNPAYQTFLSGETRWAESFEDYRAYSPALAELRVRGPRASAFWSVPLIAEGKNNGLLGMGFFQPRRFPVEERMFVATFARHCAEALRRAERHEAERLARALSERLKGSLLTTLRSIGDAVISTDTSDRVTFMNPVAEKLTGFPEAEAQGRPLSEVFRLANEQTREPIETPGVHGLGEGVAVALASHALLVSQDGRHTPIDDSRAPIRGEDGKIEGMVLVFRDVSAKKKEDLQLSFLAEATRTLGESLDPEETLKRVAHLAVPDFADWVAVDLSEEGALSARRLAVAHVDPVKVRLVKELEAKYPPDPRATRGVAHVLRTGRPELYPDISPELLRENAQDEHHLNLAMALAIRSAMIVPLIARGQTLGAMTFVAAESNHRYGQADLRFAEELCRRCALALDNARLFSAEQRARSSADLANQAKDEFLATVSHELRTPLNAIMGWSRLLSSGTLDVSKSERGLQTIERNAVAMARLIEDILDVSRIISGKMRVDLQVVDLKHVIESAIESVRPAAEGKGVQVLAALDTTAGPIMGDPTRLQQVIWNLLSNAVKFNVNGGKVEVSMSSLASAIEVSVRDTGKGIAPSFLPHVFDAFRQAESSYSRGRGGLGLGLAIAKQLTELHGGRIEAASEGLDRGALFTVHFPAPALARSNEPQRANGLRRIRSEPKFEAPIALRGLRVLVVDDDEDARMLVKAVLEGCGCSVVTAASAAEGLSAIDRERPDVLISDIGMPGEDGYDLIRRVRALPSSRGGNIPAAALTAFARSEDRRRVLSAGYSIHIPKPVEPAELVAAVTTLSRARTHAPAREEQPG
jgi:PAS domain S-box-containing protein